MGFRYTTCLESDDSLRDDKALQKKVYSAYQHEIRLNRYRSTDIDGDDDVYELGGDDYGGVANDDSSLSDDTGSEGNENSGESAIGGNPYRRGTLIGNRNLSRLPVPFYKRHKKYNCHGKPLIYVCSHCMTHVALSSYIVSDCYQGGLGNALLIYKIVNVFCDRSNNRQMTTGTYCICNVSCKQCGRYLGWKYLKAISDEQKYKEGLYILETGAVKQLSPS